ncbi:hypothetical protein PRZ48_005713 [Zasmidium cellare]|uniref:GH18 domain-containing protein n=1 Tax=Zasmidium cellare TaxID=395010 RepID=A0ABR0EMD7_ZASCE|nr:hypothetical protein PRZ48_005713 [Zasmidium cellare]
MFRSLTAWLSLLSVAAALPADFSSLDTALEKRGDGYSPPRSIVYVQTFKTTSGGQLSLLPLTQQDTKVTHIYLAAVHINDNPGDITLNDNNPNDTIWDTVWSEAAQLQSQGVKVMMMLGGAAPGSYPRLCSGSNGAINESYYVPLKNTLMYHKIQGLDLDIEEQVDVSCPVNLLKRLNQDFGTDFILTMAPVATDLQPNEYGLGGFKYSTMDSQATASGKPNGKLVNWFNAQFYNGWGDSSSPVGYNAIISNGYAADRVVLGVLDSPNDGGSGWYSINTYKSTINTLKSTYANFGGDVGWEYWDAGSNDGYSDPWQWVKEIGTAIFGAATGQVNTVSAPIPYGPSPWPALTSTLEGLGALHIEAVRALNMTNGSLDGALKLLGLSDILPLDA